ncbi:hypothetical protein Ciccas_008902 [Cichlidogyrus casuarinus]|uniref:Ubinuclein middle domain-containing protein n=1 Tax=Cichlidogyrus casuarinus TaxID=1844966 RepID=A0ABD2PZ75_9PLAT
MDSVNIVLDVPLGDCKSTMEVSYLDLLKKHIKENPEKLNQLADDPFFSKSAQADSQMEDYVRSLEKKYGTMITVKKSSGKQKIRSEAVVAPTVTTKFGGFFVHEGPIEDIEESIVEVEDVAGRKPIDKNNYPPAMMKNNKTKQLLAKAKKTLSSTKKHPIANGKPDEHHFKSPSVLSKQPPSSPSTPIKNGHSHKQIKAEAIVKPTVKQESKSSPQKSDILPSPICSTSKSPPPNLPTSLKQSIEKLINLVAQQNGKKRQLGQDFDKELVSLYSMLSTGSIAKSVRSSVMQYLEEMVNLKRKALLQRIRKEKERTECNSMEMLKQRLIEGINDTMPELMIAYEKEFLVHQERLRNWHGEASKVDAHNENCSEEGVKKRPTRPMAPRKKFRWGDSVRVPFDRIVKLKLTEYKAMQRHDIPLDDFLKKFFLESMVPLWPDGWITVTGLQALQTDTAKPVNETPNQSKSLPIDLTKFSPEDSNRAKIPPLTIKNYSPTKNAICTAVKVGQNSPQGKLPHSVPNGSSKPTSQLPSPQPKAMQSSQPPKVTQPSQQMKVAQPSQQPKVTQPSQQMKVAQPSQQPKVAQPNQQMKVAQPSCINNSILEQTLASSQGMKRRDTDLEIISVIPPKRSSIMNPQKVGSATYKNQQGSEKLQNPVSSTPHRSDNVASISPYFSTSPQKPPQTIHNEYMGIKYTQHQQQQQPHKQPQYRHSTGVNISPPKRSPQIPISQSSTPIQLSPPLSNQVSPRYLAFLHQ